MKKKIYISGRMSGLTRQEQRDRFMAAEAEAQRYGYRVCNPVRTIYWRWPWLYRLMGYHLCLCIDLWMLSRCDGIYLFNRDWTMSRGACIEQAYAHMFGLDVYRNAADLKPKPIPYERERELPDDVTVEEGV